MGWTQDLCNISYPSLTTATPFISQKILFKARALGSNLLPSEPVLKPALPSYTIYSNSLPPSYLWHFNGLPRASRRSAIHIFLVIGAYFSCLPLPEQCWLCWNKTWMANVNTAPRGGGGKGKSKNASFWRAVAFVSQTFWPGYRKLQKWVS